MVEAIPKETESKDDNLAFVAGATGRVGSRTARLVLPLYFEMDDWFLNVLDNCLSPQGASQTRFSS